LFPYRGFNNKKGALMPSTPGDDSFETRVIGLRSMILMMAGIGLLVGGYGLINARGEGFDLFAVLPSAVGLFFFVICIVTFKLGKLKLASWFVVITIFSAFTLELILTGKINQYSFYGFFVLAFLAGMVLHQSRSITLIVMVVLVAFIQVFGSQLSGYRPIAMPGGAGLDLLIHSLLLSLAAAIGSFLGRDLDRSFERSERYSQQFRAIFNQSEDAIFLTDLNFRIQELNQQATRLLQQPAEGLLGTRILDYAVDQMQSEVNELASDLLAAGRLTNVRMPFNNEDGSQQYLQISANLIFQESGAPDHIQVIVRDITERIMVEDRIQRLALKDHLTKVDNRLSLTYRLNSLITKMNRDGGNFALVYFDLDNFKSVNDQFGHLIGDRLLVAFTKRLLGAIRSSDFLARIGGDEFVLIFENYAADRPLDSAIERIRKTLENPFKIGEHLIELEASFGISRYPEDSSDPAELLDLADSAMYSSKRT
jgi:diguanylate cyclase (GGDEF)-like protein/PAS domain S-box-containing protein